MDSQSTVPGWGWNLHPSTPKTPPILLHHSRNSHLVLFLNQINLWSLPQVSTLPWNKSRRNQNERWKEMEVESWKFWLNICTWLSIPGRYEYPWPWDAMFFLARRIQLELPKSVSPLQFASWFCARNPGNTSVTWIVEGRLDMSEVEGLSYTLKKSQRGASIHHLQTLLPAPPKCH